MLPETPVNQDSAATAPVDAPPVDAALLEREAFGDTLLCPRCGYILRGLTADRCPECGLTVDWNAIIAAARRRVEVPTFEYQWRERPVASFFSTLWLSIQPWKIWKRIPLTAEPRPKVLLLFVALTLPIFLAANLVLDAFMRLTVTARYGYHTSLVLFHSRREVIDFLQINLARYAVFLGIGLFGGLSLTIFHRSLLGYRIRRTHLLRIGVHVFTCLIVVHILNETVRRVVTVLDWFITFQFALLWWPVVIVLDLAFLFLPTLSVARAARDYLQVRRPWRFAIVVLVLSYLCCLSFFNAYAVAVDSFENTVTQINFETWPGVVYLDYWIPVWLGFQ